MGDDLHFQVYAESQARSIDNVTARYQALGLHADYRNDYSHVAEVLEHFGIKPGSRIRLLTNDS